MPNSTYTPNEREQVHYLLGNAPSWMLHYGITAITIVFVTLLAMSYYIQYPDTIEAKISLTTANPPIRIMAKGGGKVSRLLIKDNEKVSAGQTLAVLENTANWKDILLLENALQKEIFDFSTPLQLGELQNDFSTFAQNYKDYDYFSTKNGVSTKKNHIVQQITQLYALNSHLEKQGNLLAEELTLSENTYRRQQQLYTQGVVSLADLEKANSAVTQQKRQIESNKTTIISNNLQIAQQKSQINDLQQTKNDTQNDKSLRLAEDKQKLLAAIAAWKSNYLVIAPISGSVSMSKIWSEQQPIGAGEEVMAVVPSETNSTVIGRANLPVANAGKVSKDMRAIVQLDGLPYQQYGTLQGSVSNMSQLAQKNEKEENYILDIAFPQPLMTTYQHSIAFRQEMTGKVRIVTESRSILSRIFDRWNDLLKNR